ncbi:hypothetical protein EDB86DRAFT_2876669 [Lactarius hatsudake]|nr:hypothetical protein EDB86DRAFT_2876669 [Lactarius hatsudake]
MSAVLCSQTPKSSPAGCTTWAPCYNYPRHRTPPAFCTFPSHSLLTMDPVDKSFGQDKEKGDVVKDNRDLHDPSSKMWALCISKADKHDTAMVERWKADMDGILIYTGVFSATVAAFLIESYKTLKPDSGEATVKLLQQVTQQLAAISNGTQLALPTSDPFTPKPYVIHVNIMWFLSLCISLSCALAATLVQQWARRYLRLSQGQRAALRRVRIRTYLHEGIHMFHTRWIVENISLLMHAAIFLFFAGLVEFLYTINHEVACAVLIAVSIFATIYVVLTSLPVIFQQCPFQTPLSSIIWYLGHLLVIASLSLFSWSNHIRAFIEECWRRMRKGITDHLANKADQKNEIDLKALRSTLSSCRDESDLEAFLDAIPGYLRSDDSGSHIADIGELLNVGDEDIQLSQQIVQLFASCVDADGRMDKTARRRRAITCARAIWEISNAFMSKRVKVDVPEHISKILQQLAQDHDAAVAFAALSTIAILERAFLEDLQDSQSSRDLDRHREMSAAFAKIIDERDPLSARYHVAQPDAFQYANARLMAVTEFITRVLPLIPHLTDSPHEDLDVAKKTLEELCRSLDGKTFSDSAQQKFVETLERARQEHKAAIKSMGQQTHKSPMATYYSIIISSTLPLSQSLGVSSI